MKALLRLMVWTLVAVVVTTAAFQVAGRLILSDLHSFEPEINRMLANADIRLSGLEGSWHRLNPVVRLGKIELPGHNNTGSGISLEVDVLESLFRNRLVMKTMTVERLTLAVTQHTDGSWRLLGQQRVGNIHFDVQSFLQHSDELHLSQGVLRLVAPDISPEEVEHLDAVRLEVKLRNRGDRHQGQISLSTLKTDCRGCGVEMSYDLIDWKPLIGPRRVSGQVVADASNFAVSREIGQLWNASGSLSSFRSQWKIEKSLARGWLKMGAKDIQFQTGTLPSLSAEAELRLNLNTGSLDSTINTLSFSGAKRSGMLEHVSMTANSQGDLWLAFPNIEVQPAIDVLQSIFQRSPKVHQWLVGLNPRGHLADGILHFGLSPALSMDYQVHVQQAELDAFKGSPQARNITGVAAGNESSLSLILASQDFEIKFPNLFAEPSIARRADGVIDFYFRPDYIGLRGHHMSVELDQEAAQGGFSLASPKVFSGRQLTLSMNVKDMGMTKAKEYIPKKLSENLRNWLEQNLMGGQIPLAALIYHGYVKPEANPSPIQLEIKGSIVDGELRFHDDWPIASGLSGDFLAGTRLIKANLQHAETLGNSFRALTVEMPANLTRVRLAADVQTTGERALNYARQSPLIEWLPFLKPEWQMRGPLNLKLNGIVPLKDKDLPLQLSIDAGLQGNELNFADIGLKMEHMEGSMQYQHPYRVVSNQLSAMIFSEPVKMSIASSDSAIEVQMDGAAKVDSVLQWLDIADTDLIDGSFAYSSTFTVFTLEDQFPVFKLKSDLQGVAIDLPGELAKNAAQPGQLDLSYQMTPSVDELKFSEGDALQGWLHFREGSLVRGAIGVNQLPALVDTASQEVVITGKLADIKAESGGAMDDPYMNFNWALIDFQIGHLDLSNGGYDNLLLNGDGDERHSSLAVQADDIAGKVEFRLGEIPHLDIAYLRFPEAESEVEDPMADIDLGFMQPADVTISEVKVGSESYGSWGFKLRKLTSGWQFQDLKADIKGLRIESNEGISWLNPQAAAEESQFAGTVSAADLAEVLPQWGYAPSVESESMSFLADLHWPGSPLAIAMTNISGEAKLNVKEGRFLDVDSANNTLRIFSLINFTAIAKRMSLDFSDVFGKGISFDKIKADVVFDHGLMSFKAPMLVEGTGSRFKVNGSVNLATGKLNNDLIVTLPVNRSLPWYAGYLSIANPLAGVGVLVGERIFRNQLEQFSSAKYSVSGTLDDPKVELVSIFTNEMNTDATVPQKPEKGSGNSTSEGGNLGKVQPEEFDQTNQKERKRG